MMLSDTNATSGHRLPPGGEQAIFTDFDLTLDEACAAAQATDGPILIVTSSRLDGTSTCSEH